MTRCPACVPEVFARTGAGIVDAAHGRHLGAAWQHGPVVLPWDTALHDGGHPRDGSNLVFHELAHILDDRNGGADGVPPLADPEVHRRWSEAMEREYGKLRGDIDAGRRADPDAYGATSRAELFAVATEAFFERPLELRADRPQVHRLFTAYYRQDPAARLERAEEQGNAEPSGEEVDE